MATKVKGEAIKENSVPLSALSDEVKALFTYIYNPIYPENGKVLPSEMVAENGKLKDEFCYKAFFAPTIVAADAIYDEESGEFLPGIVCLVEVNGYTDSEDNIIYKGTDGTYTFLIEDGKIYQNWG